MDELIRKQDALDAIHCDITVTGRQNAELVAATIGAFADRIKALPTVQPNHNAEVSKMVDDLISRQAAIDAVLDRMDIEKHGRDAKPEEIRWTLEKLPTAQAEPLTDYEQRIFLAAMGKERAVCKRLMDEWDGMKLDVPCPVNLMQLCAEVERKVKAALWTN